jgi:iron complex transport system substrate-binding protein
MTRRARAPLGAFAWVGALALAAAPSLIAWAEAAPVPKAPLRVASLNLTADEILVDILPADRLIAVTRWADDSSTSNVAGRVPAGTFRFPKADLERLVALAPDLVVVSEYTDADFLRLLERSGLRYHRMAGLDTLQGQRQALLDLGRAVGAPEAAGRLAAEHEAALRDLARRLEGASRPRVLYWANPHTAGAGTAIGALIEAAGAENVGRTLGLKGIVPLGSERAFLADPDVVLLARWPGALDALKADPLLSQLRAVRGGRIVEMPNELLITLSHHSAEACRYLAAALHPDLVTPGAGANPRP